MSIVKENGLHRKNQFLEMITSEEKVSGFPHGLSLKNAITFGSYQLKIMNILKIRKNFLVSINKYNVSENSKIITTRIQSRHGSKTKYRVFIKYFLNKQSTMKTDCNDLIKG